MKEAQALIQAGIAAAKFRRPTTSFETGMQKFGFNYLLSFDDIMAVGGGTTSQDVVLCEAVVGSPRGNEHCLRIV